MAFVFHFSELLQLLQADKCKYVSFLVCVFSLKTSAAAALLLRFKSNKLESFAVVVLRVEYMKEEVLCP